MLARAVREVAHALHGSSADFDPLMERAGDARFVLVGEATHGTHDFYRVRAELTKRLIVEQGFAAVAVEADWPDAYRVNRYVRGLGSDGTATESLAGFRRFPAWMWRNADVLDFVGWLRARNDHQGSASAKVGFYGLDLYSLHASIEAVLTYLDQTDPQAAVRARRLYACFDQFGDNPQSYGYAAGLGLSEDCEREVVDVLKSLQRTRLADGDDLFDAQENARVVRDAQEYYRAMFRGRVSSWNLRDRHMADTLDALARRLDGKVVVWAHNSHVGDARATDMGAAGELNIGQLARERHPNETLLIGFTSYSGTVTAASMWDGLAERKVMRPALPNSYEDVFHQTGVPRFLLMLDTLGERSGALRDPLLQRAIGVIYRPENERTSHYYHVSLPAQFDALVHLDETRALEPLERTSLWERGEPPETYPTGT